MHGSRATVFFVDVCSYAANIMQPASAGHTPKKSIMVHLNTVVGILLVDVEVVPQSIVWSFSTNKVSLVNHCHSKLGTGFAIAGDTSSIGGLTRRSRIFF